VLWIYTNAATVSQFQQDVKKKQAVIKIQTWFRARRRQKKWKNLGIYCCANTMVTKLIVFAVSVASYQKELTVKESKYQEIVEKAQFGEPDSEDNVYYSEEEPLLLKAATLVKLVEKLSDAIDGKLS
jgi:hypothetical protein